MCQGRREEAGAVVGRRVTDEHVSGLSVLRIPLDMVLDFKYLGRFLMESDYDWLSVVVIPRKAQRRWERLSSILGWEGEYHRTYGKNYKAGVKLTLLSDVDSWVMNHRTGKTLGGFHHRVDCRLSGIHTRRDTTGRWI